MDSIEKLSKLEQLRSSGTIDDKEFQKQKNKLLKPKRKWVRRTIIAAFGLVGLGYVFGPGAPTSPTSNGVKPTPAMVKKLTSMDYLPTCSSTRVADTIKNIYKNNVLSKQLVLKLLYIKDQTEVSENTGIPQRVCSAKVYLNVGVKHIEYTIFSPDKNEKGFIVNVKSLL